MQNLVTQFTAPLVRSSYTRLKAIQNLNNYERLVISINSVACSFWILFTIYINIIGHLADIPLVAMKTSDVLTLLLTVILFYSLITAYEIFKKKPLGMSEKELMEHYKIQSEEK